MLHTILFGLSLCVFNHSVSATSADKCAAIKLADKDKCEGLCTWNDNAGACEVTEDAKTKCADIRSATQCKGLCASNNFDECKVNADAVDAEQTCLAIKDGAA